MSHIPLIWEYVARQVLDISSLSTTDFILIVGHYLSLIRGESEEDASQIKSRGYSEAQLNSVKLQKEKLFIPVDFLGIRFRRPLYNFKYSKLGYVLMLVENFERGVLPFPGSLSEQPAQTMEIFSLIQSMKSQVQQQEKK